MSAQRIEVIVSKMLAHILIFFLLLLMTSPGSITPILVLLKIERYFSRRNSIYSYLCSISFLRNRDKFLLWQIISSFTNRKYLILVNSSKNFWHLAKISLTYNVPPNHLSFYSMTVIRLKKKKWWSICFFWPESWDGSYINLMHLSPFNLLSPSRIP